MKGPRMPPSTVAKLVITVEQREDGYVSVVSGQVREGDATSRSNIRHTPEETIAVALEKVERLLRQQLRENV